MSNITIDSTLYTRIFEKADQAFIAYLATTSNSIISAITPAAVVLLSVYIMLWGWSMMRGVINEPITDGVTRIVRLSIISGIALSSGYYSGYVTDWVWSTPESISEIISGRESRTSISFLDLLLSRFFTLGNIYMEKAELESTMGVPDLQLFFSSIAILITGVAVTAYTAFLFILSKMALAILLAVGPIFITLSIFEATKKFLDAWIGQVLNYVFLVMLTAACVKLILIFIEQYFVIMRNIETNIGDAMQLVAITSIGFLILLQMPSLASGLGGGVALSTLSSLSWSYRKASEVGKGAMRIASGATLADSRARRKRKVDMARWAAKNR